MNRVLKKTAKKTAAFLLLFTLLLAGTVSTGYICVHAKMSEYGSGYTETMERILIGMVPERGITLNGRTYTKTSVINFLDEIRWDPYNYVHKDHSCILQYATKQQIYWIVSGLRFILGCG